MPGMEEEIDKAIQHAPQSGLQSMKKIKDKSIKTKV
jgi:hypothetical protein